MFIKASYTVFIHCYSPARGGGETLMLNIVDALKSREYETNILTGKGQTLDSYKTFSHWVDMSTDPPYVHRLLLSNNFQRLTNRYLYPAILTWSTYAPWYFGPILHYERRHRQIIKRSDVLIGVAMPTKSFVDAAHFARRYGKKLILIPAYHDVSYYNNCPAFQKAFDTADAVVCLSEYERNLLTLHYVIDQRKIQILPYAPYTHQEIARLRLESEKKIQERADRIYMNKTIAMGYVGQITPRKDLASLRAILDACSQANVPVKLILAGAQTNESPLVESQFYPYIEKGIIEIQYDFRPEDKKKIYDKIDVFVNPSVEESLGIVNYEAIASGTLFMHREQNPFTSMLGGRALTIDHVDEVVARLSSFLSDRNRYVELTKSQWDVFEGRSIDDAVSAITKL